MKIKRSYKKKAVSRKSFAKKAVRRARTGRLVKLIQKVSLRKCETKDAHRILENEQLYHNTPAIQTGFLTTNQGIGDADTGLNNYASRVGNEIILRGLSMKLWIANKLDRPNVMYRIIVYRYKIDAGGYTNPPYLSQGTTNFMIRDLDTDQFKIIKVKYVNLQTGFSAVTSATAQGDQNGVECHKFVKFWLPFRNQKYKYKSDGSGFGAYWDIGLSITAYDSYGTLTTDNISSYALSHKLYFKDP